MTRRVADRTDDPDALVGVAAGWLLERGWLAGQLAEWLTCPDDRRFSCAACARTHTTDEKRRSWGPARLSVASATGGAAVTGAVGAGRGGGEPPLIARVDDGDDVTRIGVGAARLDPYRAIRTSDQVRVGSITKTMVATVALQLVGEGRLHLSDTLGQWLPGIVPDADAITIRMLLNNTSGIFDYTDDPDFIPRALADPHRYWSPQELIAIATSHPRVFAPGTGWSYSNTGYILIGLVLEKVTGAPIQTLLDRRVIKPLHLHSTYFATSSRFRGSYAHGYLPPSLSGDGYVDVSDWTTSWAWAAGAVVSNAPDLARFYRALMSGRLLEPELLEQMTTTVDVVEGFGYGLGIYTMDTPCGTIWGHDGGIPGYISFAYTDRRGSRSGILLLPTEPDDAITTIGQAVISTAVCMMLGQPVPVSATGRSAAGLPPACDRLRLPVARPQIEGDDQRRGTDQVRLSATRQAGRRDGYHFPGPPLSAWGRQRLPTSCQQMIKRPTS
jgi:D-alanyl-D-alanine carboxypeptidase